MTKAATSPLPDAIAAAPIRPTVGQIIALLLVGAVALCSSAAYPVYYRYTAHKVFLIVRTPGGAAVPVPVPDQVYLQQRERRSLNRLSPQASLPILARRVARYMAVVPPGLCEFRWTVRYSEDSTDLDKTQEVLFMGKQCP